MDRSNGYPITSRDGPEVLYCARCGMAGTRTGAMLRRFNTGFSGCCNDNLVVTRPRTILEPLPDNGIGAYPTGDAGG